MNEKKMAIISLVALAISLVFLTYFIIISVNLNHIVMESNLNIYSKASLFDSKFHDLTQEHTFLLITTVTRSLNSSTSFNASYNALQINLKEISAQIANIYGTDYANQYLTIQSNKINYFINYTIGVKNNDPNANSVFSTNIAQYEDDISNFWSNKSTIVADLDKSIIKKIVITAINDEKSAIDYWYQGDYVNYFSKLHDSYKDMGVYADTVMNAIIKQYPEKFQ